MIMRIRLTEWYGALAIGLVGWLAVLLTLRDPGFTSDEPFNVHYGKVFVSELRLRGWNFFSDETITRTFARRSEHPPLGRWVIGWVHWLLDQRRLDSHHVDLVRARVAPASVFALLLVLLVRFTSKHYGKISGAVAGLSLLLIPRVFAHAHFAALETVLSWTYFAAVSSAAWMMGGRLWLRALWAGALMGCALLTKLQGFLLLPVIGLWAVLFYRWRGLVAVILSGGIATVVFFAGWPWLWSDLTRLWNDLRSAGPFHAILWGDMARTMPRLTLFFSSSVDRQEFFVPYFGQIYRDWLLPWHYPWVLFMATVPVGLHVLGFCALGRMLFCERSDVRGLLVFGSILFPLVLFSLPRVPVYDGARLFLMVFPLWAVFVGRGAQWVWELLRGRLRPRTAGIVLAVALLTQSVGICYYHPFGLSYYNLLVGGLRGAAGLGLEVTYWGDSVTANLINRWSQLAPADSCAVLVPSLYDPYSKLYETAATARKRQQLESPDKPCPYVIVYNRKAYLENVKQLIDERSPELQISRDGVWLSAVYQRQESQSNSRGGQ